MFDHCARIAADGLKKFKALGRVFFAIVALSVTSQAAQIDFGFGGQWSALTYSSTSVSTSTKYRGAGGTVELRLRTMPFEKSRFGIDYFGNYTDSFLANVNHSAQEQNRATSYGGGMDLTYNVLFIGVQYEVFTSKISAAGYHATLNYRQKEVRAGFNFPMSDKWTMSLTGMYGLSAVLLPVNSQFVNRDVEEMRGTLLFCYRFIKIGKKGRY